MKKGTKVPALVPDGKYNPIATTEPMEEGLYCVRTSFDTPGTRPWWAYFDGQGWNARSQMPSVAMANSYRSGVLGNPMRNAEWCGVK